MRFWAASRTVRSTAGGAEQSLWGMERMGSGRGGVAAVQDGSAVGTDDIIRVAGRAASAQVPNVQALMGVGAGNRLGPAAHVVARGFTLAIPGVEDEDTVWPSLCERLARLGC